MTKTGGFSVPRPKKTRFVSGYPVMSAFVPDGIPITGEMTISIEGMEAVRLSDFEGLDQESAAGRMEISRQTYGRVLAEARQTIATALVTGKTLRIGGGMYELRGQGRCRRRRRGGR